jgi:hypothetical protein
VNEWSEASVDALLDGFERAMGCRQGSFADLETAALSLSNALVRRWTSNELARMTARYGDEVLVAGQRYRRHAPGRCRYHTLCGAVEVERDTYRLVGKHNGPTIVPLELEAELLENATPALAVSVVQAFAMMPLRDYEQEMRVAHRQIPSRSTLERIAKRIGHGLHRQLPVIEPILRSEEAIPKQAASISIGIDRTSIPMAEPSEAPPDHVLKAYVRRPAPPVVVAYRMGYVATVSVNDGEGESLMSTRIGATPEEGPIEMMERLGAELERLLGQQPTLPIVVVQDGAPELWNLIEEWTSNFALPIEMKLIDRYHVEERLAQVAAVVERDAVKRRRLMDRWRASLERSDTAIRRICKDIDTRTWGKLPSPRGRLVGIDWPLERPLKISKKDEPVVEDHLRYCKNHSRKIRYATARSRGFPIGSGVTEGACKSVMAMRFKRSGQRWLEPGVSACMLVRTLHLNGRLERGIGLFATFRRRGFELD